MRYNLWLVLFHQHFSLPERETFSMKNILIVLSLAIIIVLTSVLVTGHVGAQTSGASDQWVTFQHDAQRTGVSKLPGPGSTQPTIVYVLPACSKSNPNATTCTYYPIHSAPAVAANGNVYFGADDGRVYGYNINAHTYSPLNGFPVQLDGPVHSSPTLSSDGNVLYVGTDNGSLYAINTSNGSMKWAHPFSISGPIQTSPLLSQDGSLVIVAGGDGYVYGVNTSDGSQAWKSDKNLGGAILSSPAMTTDGSTVYVGGTDDQMHPINIHTGSTGVSAQAADPFYETPSVDTAGNQYAGNPDGYLFSYNSSNSFNWETLVGGQLSSTALTSSNVYVASSNGKLVSVKTSDGTIAWSATIDGPVATSSAPVVDSAGDIYVATTTGNIYGFTSSGSQMWEISPPGAGFVSGLVIGPNDWLLAASTDGNVYVIGQPGAAPTPPQAPTSTPTPSVSPTATPTPSATPTPTVSATPTALHLTIKVQNRHPKPHQRDKLYGKVAVGSVTVQITLRYPNGDKTVHKVEAKPHGKYQWVFTVPANKITHRSNKVTVQVSAQATGGAKGEAHTTFNIGYGHIDVSTEPTHVRVGATETIWVHSQARATVTIEIVYPSRTAPPIYGKTASSGWFHTSFKVPKYAKKGGHTARVYVWAYAGQATYFTSTAFQVK
jgi:outer membrane protein assembly factor BamB